MEIRKEEKKKWRCTLIGTCKHVDIGPLSSGPRTTMSSCFPSHKFLPAYYVFLSIPLCIFSFFLLFFSLPRLFELNFLSFHSFSLLFFSLLSSLRASVSFCLSSVHLLFSLSRRRERFPNRSSLFRIILSYLFLGRSPLAPTIFHHAPSPHPSAHRSSDTSISELSTRSYTCESESVLHPH